jgi:hypothetical protein
MTLGVAPVVAGPFTLNGVTTNFPFTFRAYREQDVEPIYAIQHAVTGAWMNADVPSNLYTVELDEDGDGGNVVFLEAPSAANGKLFLRCDPQFSQLLSLTRNGPAGFPEVMIALDKAAERDQVLLELLGRAAIAPLGGDVNDLFAPYALKSLANVTDATILARLASLGIYPGGGSGGTGFKTALSLAAYVDQALELTDEQIASYRLTGTTGWTDISEAVRQCFDDAATLGVGVSYGGLTGNFYFNPASPVLIRQGCGFDGGAFAYPTLSYTSDHATLVDDMILGGGLNFIVDPQGARRKVPKFSLQGRTVVNNLSIVGVGLAGTKRITVTGYPVCTGGDAFFTDAPVIVTDHQHLADGTWVGPGDARRKVGSIILRCSVVGVMQGVCIGDPLPSEEGGAGGWTDYCASGLVTGTGGNDITVYSGPCLRALIHVRKTATLTTANVEIDQPRWTGVTQQFSGGLFGMDWIKFIQQFGIGIDCWHRCVGARFICNMRGVRYAVKMQAGYSNQGPIFVQPTVGATVDVDKVVSAANGDIFVCTVGGIYQNQPIASGANYNTTTKVFTDVASTTRWTFLHKQPDTGKYNSMRIEVAGERIIQAIFVNSDAYLHNVTLRINGHLMDEYNIGGETGAVIDIRSHYLAAGSIDKAVYDALVLTTKTYHYGDKVSDVAGNVWVCTSPGVATHALPTTGLSPGDSYTDPGADAVKWYFRNLGWKPFGDQPFARVWIDGGIIQESSGPMFRNTKYDGHQSFKFVGGSNAAWSQGNKNDALFINKSARTSIKHFNGETYVGGKSDIVYDCVDEARLHVGGNDYYGYDLSTIPADDYPRRICNSAFSQTFFDNKNCEAHDFDYALSDDSDDGDFT